MSDVPPPPPPPDPSGPSPYGQAGYAGQTGPQHASVGARIGARIIDFIIIGIVSNIVTAILTGGSAYSTDRSYGSVALGAVITAVLYLGYFTLGESLRGQTPGKTLLKLQVEGPGGGTPTAADAAKRNLWTALGILGVLGVVGTFVGGIASLVVIILLIVQAANEASGGVTFMDKFAGARVVKKL